MVVLRCYMAEFGRILCCIAAVPGFFAAFLAKNREWTQGGFVGDFLRAGQAAKKLLLEIVPAVEVAVFSFGDD